MATRYDTLIPKETTVPVAEKQGFFGRLFGKKKETQPETKTAPAVATSSRYSSLIPKDKTGVAPVAKSSRYDSLIPKTAVAETSKPYKKNVFDKLGEFSQRPEEVPNRYPEDYTGMTREQRKLQFQKEAKEAEEIGKGQTFKKQLPSSFMEGLPFGVGQVFKTLNDVQEVRPEAFAPGELPASKFVKAVPEALLETGKGFAQGAVRGGLNYAGIAAGGKKMKVTIPGLGEISNTHYRTAERIANGESPVVVALEEGSTAILDMLFFASIASKPFTGRPTTTAKSELPAKLYERTPGSAREAGPKSFRLYEKKTNAQPLTPEFIEKAKSQGVDFGPKFDPKRPTYFRMTFDPKGVFRGEIVQIKPSWVSVIASKFKGDVSKAPPQAFDIAPAPKELKASDVENAVKTPVTETKPAETAITPIEPQKPATGAPVPQITPLSTQERTDILTGAKPAPTPEPTQSIERDLMTKYPNIKTSIHESPTEIELVSVIVPNRYLRGKGMGTSFMNDLIKSGDEKNKRVILKPNEELGGEKPRLIEFYKRFGFSEPNAENFMIREVGGKVDKPVETVDKLVSEENFSQEVEGKANTDWENNFAEEAGKRHEKVTELRSQLKEAPAKQKEFISTELTKILKEVAKIENDFIEKWRTVAKMRKEVLSGEAFKTEKPKKLVVESKPQEKKELGRHGLELAPSKAKTPEEKSKEISQVFGEKRVPHTKMSKGEVKLTPLVSKTDIRTVIKNSPDLVNKRQIVLKVDKEKNLVFDGKRTSFKIKASALNLNEDKLKAGDEITIDVMTLKEKGAEQQMRVYKDGKSFAGGGTPSGNAMAIYKDESTPEIPIESGKLKNEINPIEFPELVDLARELMGKVPQVVKKTGNASGRFYGDLNNPRIKLVAELFNGKNPRQLAQILAHEIGHLIDFLPEGTLSRGNLIGRLHTLHKFMRNTFGEKEHVTNKDIRAELMKVTQEMHPYDPAKVPASYKRYRESARELYAEAISMLLNSPGHLQEVAPKFFETFFEELDKKPDVFNAYFELQDILGGDRATLLERRRAGVRGMFDTGDMKAAEIQRARMEKKEAQNKNITSQIKLNLIDKNYVVIDRINELKKQGKTLTDDENPLYYLEERNYLGGKVKAFMEKNIQPIYKKLQENQISWTDFGEALFYDRIRAGDRSEVANPRGITIKVAEELLEKMKSEMEQEQVDLLNSSMDEFRNALKTVTEEAFKEGLYRPEMHEQMQENPAYATFQVLDYLEEGMTSKIHKSLGTLKDVANPADASLLKTISTLRAIERNKVSRSVVEFLQKNFPEDIKEAKVAQTPKGQIPLESKLPGEELVSYMKGGRRHGFYVDPYLKHSIENETIGHTIAILRVLNSALFRPLFITYNPGFQAFNFMRDFWRFWKNTPKMTIIKAMKRYIQAAPAARARAFGDITNETLQKMEEEQILSISYNQLADGADVESKQIETILRNSGIDSFQPEARNKFLAPFRELLDYVKRMGDFIETLPKVAGYLELSKGGKTEITREQKSFIRKNIGSPDFLAGGFWKPVTNEVFLFSNAITQGIRSDISVATDPKTRGGYWWKTAKANILPKILMILATLGFFGKEVEDMMDSASEYDKTNYGILPFGKDENGKTIYLRIPQDEGGRLIGGLAWKMLNATNNKQSIGKDLVDIATFTGGQLPSASPVITNAVATGQYLSGQNPYDWFRNREVLTDDQFKAGGKYSLKPFLGWLFNQSGGGVFYRFTQGAPRDQSGAEKFFNLPVVGNIVGRFVKVSDYGKTETLNQIKANVQTEKARERIDENEIINRYIKEAQGATGDVAIDKLTIANKKQLVEEILGGAPQSGDEEERAKNIVKKYRIGLQRGESDPNINALISAVTNEEKIQLVREMKNSLSTQDYNQLRLTALKYKIASDEVFIKASSPAENE